MNERFQDILIGLAGSDKVFSDIHIETSQPIMLKCPTGWEPAEVEVDGFPIEVDDAFMDDAIKTLSGSDAVAKGLLAGRQSISRAYELATCRLRINAYSIGASKRYAFSIRRQPQRPIAFNQLGLPSYLQSALDAPRGLILLTGQTGAGKTTTLASMLDYINHHRSAHIITVEDPIEFLHERDRCIFSPKEIPLDAPSFHIGLKEALRQRPDVLMVGEIRDRETAEVAMQASESGHLVLASLHANSATGAIRKLSGLLDNVPYRAQALADSLLCVINQVLVSSSDGKDFVLASELLMNSQSMSALLVDEKKLGSVNDLLNRRQDNCYSLNSCLLDLIRQGRIRPEEAMKHTNDRMGLQTELGKIAVAKPT